MLFSFQMQIKRGGLKHKLCPECQSLRKCTEYLEEKKNYIDHVSVFTK